MDLKVLLERERMRQAIKPIDHADNSLYGSGFSTTMRVSSDRPSKTKIWTKGMSVARGKVTQGSATRVYDPTAYNGVGGFVSVNGPTREVPEPREGGPSTDKPGVFMQWVSYAVARKLTGMDLQRIAARKIHIDRYQEFIDYVRQCMESVPAPPPLPIPIPIPQPPQQYDYATPVQAPKYIKRVPCASGDYAMVGEGFLVLGDVRDGMSRYGW